MEREAVARAEEAVRLLASAANAARLYPRSSALPRQAIERFVAACRSATASGPLRFSVDRTGLRVDDIAIGAGHSQLGMLAESLHALQVGQLILAPELTTGEAEAFLDVLNTEARTVRESGGVRAALVAAGVSRIATIEVTLRASTEEGLAGLDLALAPLEDIGRETVTAVRKWAESVATGTGSDEVASVTGGLEEAARELAQQRIAEALLRLPEDTRIRLMTASFAADATGKRMQGMLDVIARMSPAALARLLMVVAARLGTEPDKLVPPLDLPPEVLEEVMMLVTPSPTDLSERGVPVEVDPSALAEEATAEESTADLDRQMAVALPSLASGRALSTTVAVAKSHPSEDAVAALGEALPQAARDGAFPQAHEALSLLADLAEDPSLTQAVSRARSHLADPGVLADVVSAPLTDSDAAVVGEIVAAAGQAGMEALLSAYHQADEHDRVLLAPVLRGMSELVVGAASRIMRSTDALASVSVLEVLPVLGDKRALGVLTPALDNLDVNIRSAAVHALAEMPLAEARQALVKGLAHWDPQTARYAVREIGRVRAEEALPSLLRQLEDINVFERKHELKKEIIRSLESIGSPKAVPALRRVAGNRLAFGRKNKELRFLASRAVAALEADDASTQTRAERATDQGDDAS